jgi:hypothetical protein
MSILKCTFIQIFINFPDLYHNPIENLGRIEKAGKIAIIKQQMWRACALFMKFYLKNAKIAGRKPSAARC